ncbi:serine hydrolase [Nocardia sp. NBC_01327]|uniref:serine hydrolase n=1 Tax=Nocardia sp. NBC_01327 TaxID=2903593 RepID=UPI002E10E3E1|nr:serine hydrolase [Nocardia sp. NBC_01327]
MSEKRAPERTAAAALEWVLEATTRVPLPDSEIGDRVAPALLDAAGGSDGFNAAIAGLGRPEVSEIRSSRPDTISVTITGEAAGLLVVHVDAEGRIDTARLIPAAADRPAPISWGEIDTRLAELGGRVSFAAARIDADGQPRVIHSLHADTARPLGSGFKLYVLAALAHATATGTAGWQEMLAIREEWKSLPSGTLQLRPAGERLTLATYADHMMSISDNTATDHLIHHLGRHNVHRQLAALGHHNPDLNTPFLTTKALFQCKVPDDADHAPRYLAAPQDQRLGVVEELELLALPDPAGSSWTRPPQPRYIDEIEWFATPADICRAYAGLLRFDQPEIDHALTRDDQGLDLDSARFPTVWSKPGSEPGVLTLNYLARTTDNQSLVTSLMVSDPVTAFDDVMAGFEGLAIVRGTFQLLDSMTADASCS